MIQIDMEMPKCCSECDFEIFNGSTDECLFVYNGYTDKIRTFKRLDACPLHEVADTDTISRKQAIDAIEKACETSAQDNYGVVVCNSIINLLKVLPPSPTPSRPQEPHIASLETPCDDCDFTEKCTYESNCPREAIWKAVHEGGAV